MTVTDLLGAAPTFVLSQDPEAGEKLVGLNVIFPPPPPPEPLVEVLRAKVTDPTLDEARTEIGPEVFDEVKLVEALPFASVVVTRIP